MRAIEIRECADWLLEHDNYLILSHKRPDGDTLGSGGALCAALRRLGKTAYCHANEEITENYMEYAQPYFAPEGYKADFVIAADTADEKLLPRSCRDMKVDLCVDHHISNTGYADLVCNKPELSACGEVVLKIIREMSDAISAEEANLLYVAITTDTGCFQYMNTTADTFTAAGDLVRYGADSARLNKKLFRSSSRARLALEARMLTNLKYYREGRLVVSVISMKDMDETGATENDCDDISGVTSRVESCLLSVTLKELAPDLCKLSLRSAPPVDSGAICTMLGGGGHKLAAGCTIRGDIETSLSKVMKAIDEVWKIS